jgi:thiol-disulfide isomerase/thioredoxin
MKKLLAVLFLVINILLFNRAIAQTQTQSDFEILEGKNDSDIVYRGPVTFDDISHVSAFHLEAAAGDYNPKNKAIKALSNELAGYKLLVFLGTWCEDSHRMIPQLYKVLKLANYPMENLSLDALDRDKLDKNGKAPPYEITRVPTIVVLKNGTEIGRITEMPDKSVEQDLLKIINHH